MNAFYSEEIEEAERDPILAEDPDVQYGYENYLEGERVNQEHAMATMALSMLASLVESFLDETRLRLDERAFPTKRAYPGKSLLLKRVSEYKERFGIDLVNLLGFESVREVVLARNSCIHNDGHPSEDYLKQTKHRLVEEVDEFSRFFNPTWESHRYINFNLETLVEVVGEISQFADSLHKSLNTVRLTSRNE